MELSPLSPAYITASSCLDDDEDTHGPNGLMGAASSIAGADENGACWRSRGGEESATLTLHFSTPVDAAAVELSFAVGFAARTVRVCMSTRDRNGGGGGGGEGDGDEDGEAWIEVGLIDTDADAHGTQRFALKSFVAPLGVRALRLEFINATDLFGRLIVYRVAALG